MDDAVGYCGPPRDFDDSHRHGGVGDPVGTGFVATLARPGGNITGVSNISSDLTGKQVELLIEIVPGMNHVGLVANLKNPGVAFQLRETEKAFHALGLQFEFVEASVPDEFDRAFARLSTNGVKGVVLLADPSLIEHGRRIAKLAQEARVPTVFQRRENVEAGGLLSYGPNLNGQFREVAVYVDKLLKGAKPADLPVELPTKFELVINLKTAGTRPHRAADAHYPRRRGDRVKQRNDCSWHL